MNKEILWYSTAPTPYGNEYGLLAVVAKTRDEAIAKAELHLSTYKENYEPHARYIAALRDNLAASMTKAPDYGVVIAWDAVSA